MFESRNNISSRCNLSKETRKSKLRFVKVGFNQVVYGNLLDELSLFQLPMLAENRK